MVKRLFICLLVITSMAFWVQDQASASNLADIETPLPAEEVDFTPVEVFVSLEPGANPDTFRAWLNGKEISSKFQSVSNGKKALLGPQDGLRIFEEDESGSLYGKGLNLLSTLVKGSSWWADLDFRMFFVETGTVQTQRDDKGVWFISGSDRVSLYYIFEAMGYSVASDRLWQMETYRRQGLGTLSEIFGKSQLPTDIFIRTIRYSDEELTQGFEDLDPESQKVIKGYVAGINRRIAEIQSNPSLLPIEFISLGFQPAKWTNEHVLAWISMLLRNFDPEALDTGQMENAALYQDLVARFPASGLAMFQDLRWTNDPEAQTYILNVPEVATAPIPEPVEDTHDFGPLAQAMKDRFLQFKERLEKIKAHVKMGSYAWVVSGDKTVSRNPIIYSGPQMGFSAPAIVAEGSIQAGGMNVSGMTVPGIPGIIIGRTPHHAWSMQVGHSHTTDYYLEDISSIVLNRYETIHVKGGSDVTIPVFRTDHGPVVNPMPFDPTVVSEANPIVAWKYAHWGYEFDTISGFLGLARAESMDEFGEAIEDVGVSQHFCYADQDGNIAYWMSGRDPVRPTGEWRLPQGAAGLPQEWDADVLIQRATDRNASRGYYGGWNNKTHPGYDSGFNGTNTAYGPFHRSHVIYDYFDETIGAGDKLGFEEVRDLALRIATTDSFGGGGNPWKFVEDDFIEAVNADPTPERTEALGILTGWDGHFVAGGPSQWAFGMDRADGWVLMDAWIRRVLEMTFADELGDTQSERVLFNVLLHGLADDESGIKNNYDWFQNADTSAPDTADEIIVAALDEVLAELGPTRPWGTNARGLIPFEHTFLGTLYAMPFSSRSTYAHCVEYGENGPVRIESMFPLGESGNILMGQGGIPVFDPNFYSMTGIFDDFSYRPFPLFDN